MYPYRWLILCPPERLLAFRLLSKRMALSIMITGYTSLLILNENNKLFESNGIYRPMCMHVASKQVCVQGGAEKGNP